ncbi:MAG: diaminopimelate epimerase [Phycisphaerales bacterium]|nr:MAG: diaminopimelate epimerase [Phycisphaerales bacterium]
MRFTKMHGLSNDYVFLDAFAAPPIAQRDDLAALTRAVSDRRTGVGSDGLIVLEPPGPPGSPGIADSAGSPGPHARMRIYNSDGSDGERCGNGLRCAAKLLVERGHAPAGEVRIETTSGDVLAAFAHADAAGRVQRVRVDMGPPNFEAAAAPCDLAKIDHDHTNPSHVRIEGMNATIVSVGNPHVVVFLDTPLDRFELETIGLRVETHPAFPKRTNLQIAHITARDAVAVRTWERGAGATQACGTGACAVLAAGVRLGLLEREATVTLPGGDLHVRWDQKSDRIEQTGPAVEVFTGEWNEQVSPDERISPTSPT